MRMPRAGNPLKPLSVTQRRVRHREGAPSLWLIADQGGTFVNASDRRPVTPTYSGSITTGAGRLGPALVYDGSTSMVNLGTATFLQPSAASDWTLLLWARPVGVNAYQELYRCGTMRVFFSSGNLAIDDLLNQGASVGAAALANTWIFVASTWRPATRTYTIAANGRTPASVTEPATRTPTGSTSLGGTSGAILNGMLDCAQVYERALTQSEILVEYIDPWWRLRRRRPWWMTRAGGIAPAALHHFRRRRAA